MDPPNHMKQRSMVEPMFTSVAVDKLRPHIQKTVDSILEKMIAEGNGKADLVDKFAIPIPSYVSSSPEARHWKIIAPVSDCE